jgi:hypothetical protein
MGFEVAAEAYEAFMGRWSRLLAVPFVDFVGIVDGMRVLDVGCGTGALTDELLSRLPGSSVAARSQDSRRTCKHSRRFRDPPIGRPRRRGWVFNATPGRLIALNRWLLAPPFVGG